jgi:hypothetical protein
MYIWMDPKAENKKYHRGDSQIVHFSTALPGFDNIHVEHVQLELPLVLPGAFIPAAAQLKAFTGAADTVGSIPFDVKFILLLR